MLNNKIHNLISENNCSISMVINYVYLDISYCNTANTLSVMNNTCNKYTDTFILLLFTITFYIVMIIGFYHVMLLFTYSELYPS